MFDTARAVIKSMNPKYDHVSNDCHHFFRSLADIICVSQPSWHFDELNGRFSIPLSHLPSGNARMAEKLDSYTTGVSDDSQEVETVMEVSGVATKAENVADADTSE